MNMLEWLLAGRRIRAAEDALLRQRGDLNATVETELHAAIQEKYGQDPRVWAATNREIYESVRQRLLERYRGIVDARLDMVQGMSPGSTPSSLPPPPSSTPPTT